MKNLSIFWLPSILIRRFSILLALVAIVALMRQYSFSSVNSFLYFHIFDIVTPVSRRNFWKIAKWRALGPKRYKMYCVYTFCCDQYNPTLLSSFGFQAEGSLVQDNRLAEWEKIRQQGIANTFWTVCLEPYPLKYQHHVQFRTMWTVWILEHVHNCHLKPSAQYWNCPEQSKRPKGNYLNNWLQLFNTGCCFRIECHGIQQWPTHPCPHCPRFRLSEAKVADFQRPGVRQ